MRLPRAIRLSRLRAARPLYARARSPRCAAATGWTSRCSLSSRRSSAGRSAATSGTSIEYGRPVAALLAERLPATLLLGGTVLLLNFTLGLWLGVRQAVRKGQADDRWLTTLSLAGYAMPSFWLGLVLAVAGGRALAAAARRRHERSAAGPRGPRSSRGDVLRPSGPARAHAVAS